MFLRPRRTTHRLPPGARVPCLPRFNRFVMLAVVLVAGCVMKPEAGRSPAPVPCNCEADVVQAFADAYRARDHARLAGLLAPDFTFYRDAPDPQTGELSWDRATEVQIHQRMFDPSSIPANDTPLAHEFWLMAVSITLTAQTSFTERLDLYTTADPPGPIDPALWLAEEATYSTDLFLTLQGEDDYVIRGRAYAVVLTDRTKALTDPGKFLLYRLEDLGGTGVVDNTTQSVIEATWTSVKEIYR